MKGLDLKTWINGLNTVDPLFIWFDGRTWVGLKYKSCDLSSIGLWSERQNKWSESEYFMLTRRAKSQGSFSFTGLASTNVNL